jgi:hypothetical protein
MAEKMHSQRNIYFYESCSMETLANTLDLYKSWNIVSFDTISSSAPIPGTQRRRKNMKQDEQPLDDPLVRLVPPYDQEKNLQTFVDKLTKFRRVPLVSNKSFGLKHVILSEFPAMAKL